MFKEPIDLTYLHCSCILSIITFRKESEQLLLIGDTLTCSKFQVPIFSNSFDDLSCWFTFNSFILSLTSCRQAIDHNLLLGCIFARFEGRNALHAGVTPE